MQDFNTINSVKSDAHSFRVTLNIIQHSSNVPLDLAAVIEKLETHLAWDRHSLSKQECEVIYAHLDNTLVEEALGEWDVQTHRMRDWGFPFWRPDYHDWWDGEHRAVDCRLCGHRDNRYEFPLVNKTTGKEIWTGSTCIVKYGVTVDGDGCAETALAKLRECMGKSKRAQTRYEWEKAHPDHADAMSVVEAALPITNRKYIPWGVRNAVDGDGRRILPLNFESQRKALGKWARAASKYYRKNGFLTPQRTAELWRENPDGSWSDGEMILRARSIVADYSKATEHDPREMRREASRKFWSGFIADHPHMNDYQKRQVEFWRDRGYLLDDLYDRNRALVSEIEQQHADRKKKKPGKAGKVIPHPALKKLPWA